MILRLAGLAAAFALLAAPALAAPAPAPSRLDAIAQDFVRLTLEAGEREPGYVDAYYGPPAWAGRQGRAARGPALRAEAERLAAALAAVHDGKALTPDERRRKAFLAGQLKAAQTRLAMLSGQKFSFPTRRWACSASARCSSPWPATIRSWPEIAALLPGDGALADRVDAFQANYVIPRTGWSR
jgi:hypothetical protein